jgi:hypothetical protein
MNSDARDNAPTSATTSPSARDSRKAADRSDAGYLAAQADQAKAAMHRAWSDIAAGLQQGVNPAEWTRDYPWIALLSATAAGFVAGATIVPSKQQQTLRKLAELERALNPPLPQPPPPSDSSDNAAPRSRLWFELTCQLLRVVAPILGRAVAAAIAEPGIEPADNNGDSAAPERRSDAPAQSDFDAT